VLRHPTPLYESGLLLILAVAFLLVPPRKVGSGRRALIYFAIYGVVRLITEHFRGDAVRGLFFGGLVSTSELLSVGLTLGCLVMLTRPRFRATASSSP